MKIYVSCQITIREPTRIVYEWIKENLTLENPQFYKLEKFLQLIKLWIFKCEILFYPFIYYACGFTNGYLTTDIDFHFCTSYSSSNFLISFIKLLIFVPSKSAIIFSISKVDFIIARVPFLTSRLTSFKSTSSLSTSSMI